MFGPFSAESSEAISLGELSRPPYNKYPKLVSAKVCAPFSPSSPWLCIIRVSHTNDDRPLPSRYYVLKKLCAWSNRPLILKIHFRNNIRKAENSIPHFIYLFIFYLDTIFQTIPKSLNRPSHGPSQTSNQIPEKARNTKLLSSDEEIARFSL